MKNAFAVALLLCATFSVAYSFKCYICSEELSKDECDKNKSEMNCTDAEPACLKADADRESGKSVRTRACMTKTFCEDIKKKCKDGDYSFDESSDKIKSCSAECCYDKELCNGACTFTANVVVLSATILFSLNMY